jgi:radical SAM superfamily enzyme YgiQ (UPF0313 family)
LKVALVDPSVYATNYGLRCISSYLWKNGVQTRMAFLSPDAALGETGYSEEVLEDLLALVSDCDVVGFSVFTNFYYRAAALSALVKKRFPDKLVVWGGVHATVSPESSIKHADVVCLGEGEETLLEIAQRAGAGESIDSVKGAWVKKRGGIVRNEARQLEENLDKYPYQDYEPEHTYVIRGGRIKRMNEEMLRETLALGAGAKKYFGLETSENYQYLTMTSRAGLTSVEIGLQTASERVHRDVYKRPFNAKIFMDAARTLAEFPDIVTYYDVILDNPYETVEDVSETVRFLAAMPKPFHASCFSLTFFPGTELYERAVADGLASGEDLSEIAAKKNNALYLDNAYSKILVLASAKASPKLKFVFEVAANPKLMKALSHPLPDKVLRKILKVALKR